MYTPHREEIRAVTDDAFFHIVYYCLQPEQDAPDWQRGSLAYGLYVTDDIPFFLVHLTGSGLAFEVNINVHTLSDEVVDNWLNSDRTLVPMLLMDAHTNIIRAMRMLSVKSSVAEQLRNCLERQDARYANAEAVERATDALLRKYTTGQLLKMTAMHRAT